MKTSPRFIVTARGPRYGSRDEIVGWTAAHTVAVAETRGWLNRQLETLPDYYFSELDVDVIDTQPEKDSENWGPKLPPFGMYSENESDDLPF